ncbi:MAG TPA: N-acetylmuramoyl-L-alanine amidase [Terriglobales bacterium]|nr:N-acetylmuramoyl-L-alanine amidase [Terriglobales bacterium]
MPWSKYRRRSQGAAAVAALLLVLLASAPSAEEKQLSIYGPRVSYSLPVSEHEGQDYVALLEALEPFGNVSARAEGAKWKLRFNRLEAEFRQGTSVGKVAGQKFGLPGRFVLENGRGLVPLRALPAILGLMLATRTEYHEAGRRLFLGGVATHFTTDPRENGLRLNFSAPVNPLIGTEPGKLKMSFTRDAVVANASILKLENPLVSSITFSESNGEAELVVLGRVPLLAQFAADRKAIEIVPAPSEAQSAPPAAIAGTALPAAAPGTALPAVGTLPAAVAVPPPPTLQSLTAKPAFVVMLDAGHGGDDRGALLNETLEEKGVTLAFARRLRSELQGHGISVVMSRDADVTVAVEQRAAMADAARVAVYLSLHAASQGPGVRVYTALINSASSKPGGFVPWDTAQARYVLSSRALAELVKAELLKHEIPSSQLSAPVKPLNNVAAAALAIEVAPSGADVGSVSAGVYQQRIAAAIAEAVVVGRARVEAER